MYYIRGVNQDGRIVTNIRMKNESEAVKRMYEWLNSMGTGGIFIINNFTAFNKDGSRYIRVFIVDAEGIDENPN